jgi:Fur family ferric uptake transcriptional regulator
MHVKDFEVEKHLLREHGYRATEGRMRLLNVLRSTHTPRTVNELYKYLHSILDKVTLYRALEDFAQSKIVTKVNLVEGVIHYEFLHKDHHHHHIVCEVCGKIEDIESCDQTNLIKETLSHSKQFKVINSHALEFFGTCSSCCRK